MVMEVVPSSCENNGIDIRPDTKPPDLEYANNVVLLGEDTSKLPVLLDCLNN